MGKKHSVKEVRRSGRLSWIGKRVQNTDTNPIDITCDDGDREVVEAVPVHSQLQVGSSANNELCVRGPLNELKIIESFLDHLAAMGYSSRVAQECLSELIETVRAKETETKAERKQMKEALLERREKLKEELRDIENQLEEIDRDGDGSEAVQIDVARLLSVIAGGSLPSTVKGDEVIRKCNTCSDDGRSSPNCTAKEDDIDPLSSKAGSSKRSARTCKICYEKSHNSRTCPAKSNFHT